MKFASRLLPEGRRVGTGEFRCQRSVPVGRRLAGGLLLQSRNVCTSAPVRRPGGRSVSGKLAGWLIQSCRGTLASALR